MCRFQKTAKGKPIWPSADPVTTDGSTSVVLSTQTETSAPSSTETEPEGRSPPLHRRGGGESLDEVSKILQAMAESIVKDTGK